MLLVLGEDREHLRFDGVFVERIAFGRRRPDADRPDRRKVVVHAPVFHGGLRVLAREQSLKTLDGVEQHVEQLLVDHRPTKSKVVEKIFEGMGHGTDVMVAKHARNTLERMNATEDFVDQGRLDALTPMVRFIQ